VRRAVLVALLTAATAGRAEAFVRTLHVGNNNPVFWQESCVPFTIYLNGFERPSDKSNMSLADIIKSVTEAAHAWSTDAVTCPGGGAPDLELVPMLAPTSAPPPAAAYDARNSVIFRTDNWSKSGKPATVDNPDYASGALALTTVTSDSSGRILDVDVEINAVSVPGLWTNLDPGVVPVQQKPEVDSYDLQDALTHEFGHFIGLAHTCFNPDRDKMRLKDDAGQDVPQCGDASPPAAMNAVMYYQVNPNEVSKRVLSPDDIRAVCTVYAPSRPHVACALDRAPVGCAVAARGRHAGNEVALGVLAALGLLAEGVRRRAHRISDRGRARA
jgi:hypothetical protein